MKALLTAIKARLQQDLSYVRASDVFITEDEHMIPEAVKFPAIGIKDGVIVRRELAGGMLEITLNVNVVIWVKLLKDEATIMGDAATGKKGVLEIEDDIHEALDENLLDITGMQEAFSPEPSASELFGDETEAVQRKVVGYRYVKEEERA